MPEKDQESASKALSVELDVGTNLAALDKTMALKFIEIGSRLFTGSLFLGLLVGGATAAPAAASTEPTLRELKEVQVELTAQRRDLNGTIQDLESQQVLITEELERVQRNLDLTNRLLGEGDQSPNQKRNLEIRKSRFENQVKALEIKKSVVEVRLSEARENLVAVERDLERYSSQIGDGVEDVGGRFGRVKVGQNSEYMNPNIQDRKRFRINQGRGLLLEP